MAGGMTELKTKSLKIKDTAKNSKMDLKSRSYAFALEIIKLIDSLNGDRASRIIGDQLLRSSTSIGANIIEAKSSSSKKEFTSYLNISLRSANETKYWLELLRDSSRAKGMVDSLLGEVSELSRMLASSIITLRNKKL
jgi:four helix bundle protein